MAANSPKKEMQEGKDYGYTGPKKFIHENIYALPPDDKVRNDWDICICQTCYLEPLYYCAGCCCAPCYAFSQRKALLGDRMQDEYMCCQGAYGKCWCTPLFRIWPECSLFFEAFCCPSCAVSGNRKEMTYIYPVADTLCETIIMIIGAILSFFGYFGTLIICLTNGCLNSQQEREWIKNEGKSQMTPYFRWGEDNFICDCCSVESCQPCCGEPCNPLDGLYCFACWFCCYCCTAPKLLAYENGQDCLIVNHCLPYVAAYFWSYIFSIISTPFYVIPCCYPVLSYIAAAPCCALNAIQRHNTRTMAKVGNSSDWFGDFVISNCYCTSVCGWCQQCRTVPKESWDWLAAAQEGKIGAMDLDNCRFVADVDEVYVPGKSVEWEEQPIPPLLPCLGDDEEEK